MKLPAEKPRPNTANRRKWQLRWDLIRRDGAECKWCGEWNLELLTVDHIVRKADGGSDSLKNLQILCRRCHDIKDGFTRITEDRKKRIKELFRFRKEMIRRSRKKNGI